MSSRSGCARRSDGGAYRYGIAAYEAEVLLLPVAAESPDDVHLRLRGRDGQYRAGPGYVGAALPEFILTNEEIGRAM